MPKIIFDEFWCCGISGKIARHRADKHYARGYCRRCYVERYYKTYLQYYRASEEYKERRKEYDIRYQLKKDNQS